LDAEQLEFWKFNSVKQLQELVEKEYSKPIDELVIYLEAVIDKEAG